MQIPFFRPHIGDDEIQEVTDCLRNGWLTTGPKTKAFEEAFADYLGGGCEAIAINSATAGLHLALEALGIGPGDEVIVPDYTFTATAEVVRYLGADPVFVDVDYSTLNVTADRIEAAITPKTKAVMPVHFAGLSCDMAAIRKVVKKQGIRIVEDAAHALPTRHDGQLIGGEDETDIAVFSFYANKTITTGEGGMLVSRDPEIIKRAKVMRLHGFDRDAFNRFKNANWRYDVIAPGYKYNMTDIAAALGIHQLKKADFFHQERARIAARYDEGLRDLPLDLPTHAAQRSDQSWHIYIIRLREAETAIDRDTLFNHLSNAKITCSVHYTPLHQFSYWREEYDLEPQHFPNSEKAGRNAITLPMYVGMEDAEIDYVVATIKSALTDD